MSRTFFFAWAVLLVPACAQAPARVVAAAVSGYHTCAVVSDGSVWCWGENASGCLGDGTHTNRRTPVRVKGLDDAIDVAVSEGMSCAVRRTGEVLCWGVGDPSVAPVGNMQDAVKVASTGRFEMCAIRRSHRLACWQPHEAAMDTTISDAADFAGAGLIRATNGRIISGEDPSGRTQYHSANMREGQGNRAGPGWTCLLDANGQVTCKRSDQSEPAPVGGLGRATGLAMLPTWGCTYDSQGAVECWDPSSAPPNVRRLPAAGPVASFAEMSGRHEHVCAIRRDGRLACWTDNVANTGRLGVAGTNTAAFDVVYPAIPPLEERRQR